MDVSTETPLCTFYATKICMAPDMYNDMYTPLPSYVPPDHGSMLLLAPYDVDLPVPSRWYHFALYRSELARLLLSVLDLSR
jgi:hypothetical protein